MSANDPKRTYVEKEKSRDMWQPGFVRSLKILFLRVLVDRTVLHDQMNLVLVEYELVIFLNRRYRRW